MIDFENTIDLQKTISSLKENIITVYSSLVAAQKEETNDPSAERGAKVISLKVSLLSAVEDAYACITENADELYSITSDVADELKSIEAKLVETDTTINELSKKEVTYASKRTLDLLCSGITKYRPTESVYRQDEISNTAVAIETEDFSTKLFQKTLSEHGFNVRKDFTNTFLEKEVLTECVDSIQKTYSFFNSHELFEVLVASSNLIVLNTSRLGVLKYTELIDNEFKIVNDLLSYCTTQSMTCARLNL